MNDAAIFDPVEAGRYLGGTKPLTPHALAIHRLKGTGPQFFRVGRLIRYRREDLDSYIADQLRSSTSQPA